MQRVLFLQLNKENQINRTTTPVLVSSTQNPDEETEDVFIQRHSKFLRLPEKNKNKLASVETSKKIQLIGQKYNFDLLRLANITRLIREYYFGEVLLENFPREIEKRMSVSLLTAQEISRYLKTEILDWDPWVEYVAKLPKAPIRELLVKFPVVGDQLITENEIEIKNFPESLRPSIRNWLHDYTQHLGQERHSSMQRMDYVFHSENTMRLSSPEREKLAIILRSFDDNEPLPIDTENSEVLFDAVENKLEIPKSFPPGGVMAKKPEAVTNFLPGQAPPAHISSPDFTRQFDNRSPSPKIPGASAGFIKPYPQTFPPKQMPVSQNFSKQYQRPTIPPPTPKTSAGFVRQSEENNIGYTRAYSAPIRKTPAPDVPLTSVADFRKSMMMTPPPSVQAKEMQFSSPYPKPETHEIPSAEPEKNIANVKFSEGAPKKEGFQTKIPSPQIPPRILRPRNIIRPYSGSESSLNIPDPRIEGNLVDLSGKKDSIVI
jgi:hypothetical protein